MGLLESTDHRRLVPPAQIAARLCRVLQPVSYALVLGQGHPLATTRAERWRPASAASLRRPAPFIRADVVLGRDRYPSSFTRDCPVIQPAGPCRMQSWMRRSAP